MNARLQGPDGLAFDRDGNLYIADFSGERVRMVGAVGR
jgi:sugar lactone lactonase YvrE